MRVLDDKNIIKADFVDFGPLFLVRFPYNYLGKNELIPAFTIDMP